MKWKTIYNIPEVILLFSVIVFFSTTISVCINLINRNRFDNGRDVGTVTASNGKRIYLTEQFDGRLYSIVAFSKHGNRFIEEKVFKSENSFQSSIRSVEHDSWVTSAPDGAFFVFNKSDKTLYIPLFEQAVNNPEGVSHEVIPLNDRYLVYQFDGKHFIYKKRGAGFWLEKSLHSFNSLIFVGKSNDFLIRIDEIENGFRYTAWKHNCKMSCFPAIMLTSKGMISFEGQRVGYSFENNGYYYEVWTESYPGGPKLKVKKGDQLIIQQDINVLAKTNI